MVKVCDELWCIRVNSLAVLARGIAQLMIESAAVKAKACETLVNKPQAEVGSDLPVERVLAI